MSGAQDYIEGASGKVGTTMRKVSKKLMTKFKHIKLMRFIILFCFAISIIEIIGSQSRALIVIYDDQLMLNGYYYSGYLDSYRNYRSIMTYHNVINAFSLMF